MTIKTKFTCLFHYPRFTTYGKQQENMINTKLTEYAMVVKPENHLSC